MTHDYKRNGTTTLFAVLDVRIGEVIGVRVRAGTLTLTVSSKRRQACNTSRARSALVCRSSSVDALLPIPFTESELSPSPKLQRGDLLDRLP
jgi:hypothetical protein